MTEQELEYLQKYEDLLKSFADNKELYNHLEAVSVKLHNRVKAILQALVFNESTSDPVIYQAVKLFVEQKGHCSHQSPTEFLSKDEQEALLDKHKFRPSLYKILLFMHVADAISL